MAAGGKGVLKLVGRIFTVVGLVLLGAAGFTGSRQYTILKSWPAVDAQVTKSRVAHYESSSSQNSTTTTMYQVEIEFRYTVDRKEYVTPTASNYSSSSYPEMKREAETYGPGTHHSIRYNPADPNDIRYDVGYSFGFFLLPVILGGMGLVFGAVGVGLLFASRSVRQLLCPSCGQTVEKGQNFCPNCAAPVSSG